MDAKKILMEIEKLENQLEILMLSNCSLSDLDEVINLQATIFEKNLKYHEVLENGCF